MSAIASLRDEVGLDKNSFDGLKRAEPVAEVIGFATWLKMGVGKEKRRGKWWALRGKVMLWAVR